VTTTDPIDHVAEDRQTLVDDADHFRIAAEGLAAEVNAGDDSSQLAQAQVYATLALAAGVRMLRRGGPP
jgi:hypothetical protein